ncbi:hypothetical protein GOP47_0030504 [Adiantum capillus-veneris]|nr:hypothetical protein GOP47_0030504 [Adiantum capillus-veneris]
MASPLAAFPATTLSSWPPLLSRAALFTHLNHLATSLLTWRPSVTSPTHCRPFLMQTIQVPFSLSTAACHPLNPLHSCMAQEALSPHAARLHKPPSFSVQLLVHCSLLCFFLYFKHGITSSFLLT